jgi:hypothetical protein
MKLVEEYEKLLKEAHGENCPWRNKSCDGQSPTLFMICASADFG